MNKIASQPEFFWFGDDSPENARTGVEEVVGEVKLADSKARPALGARPLS